MRNENYKAEIKIYRGWERGRNTNPKRGKGSKINSSKNDLCNKSLAY